MSFIFIVLAAAALLYLKAHRSKQFVLHYPKGTQLYWMQDDSPAFEKVDDHGTWKSLEKGLDRPLEHREGFTSTDQEVFDYYKNICLFK